MEEQATMEKEEMPAMAEAVAAAQVIVPANMQTLAGVAMAGHMAEAVVLVAVPLLMIHTNHH